MPYWTAEQDAELTRLWADPDMSTTQIASVMGFPSHNKVIGRAYRLGLEKRKPANRHTFRRKGGEQTGLVQRLNSGKPLREKFSVKINHTGSLAPEPLPSLNVFDSDIPAAQRRNVLSLTNETCRWPVGDPATADFFFCGGNAMEGQPYCLHHAKRAFSGQGGRP